MSKVLTAAERIALQVKEKGDKARANAAVVLKQVDKEKDNVINSIAYNQPGYRL